MIKADWIAADWGTSSLRVWALNSQGEILETTRSDLGMARLEPDHFEAALLDLIEPWLGAATTKVIICGMAGARQGWIEAPYQQVPCKPIPDKATHAPSSDPRIDVTILPGISQDSPADVIRGEETQIAGFIAQYPEFDGILCLPGTHTKWVHISAGEIISFRTIMTGEMFAVISENTVLRHSVTGQDIDMDAFDDAVSETLSRPEILAQKLFSLRAEDLLDGLSPATARGRLSGWLIGMELAATRVYWLGQPVAILGDEKLTGNYHRALKSQGLEAMQTDVAPLTIAGLATAYIQQKSAP